MNKITIEEIRKACCGQLLSGDETDTIDGVAIDSRKIKPGQLFVPIIGAVHDAHKFLPQVYEAGCRTFLVSDRKAAEPYGDCNVVLVEDTTKGMQLLAKYYLEKLNLKKITVTGSVGKTSTRDMVYSILSEKYKTGTTVGNLNSDWGVPLTIFSFDDSMEAAVLEIGMDRFGEIHRLVDIIRPEVGLITNVGISHVENLGSREGILQAKMETVDFFGEENTLVINQSNDMLSTVESDVYRIIRVGLEPSDDYYVHDICDHGDKGVDYQLTVKAEGRTYPVHLDIPGAHNALNSAMALAGCRLHGVETEDGIPGLRKVALTGSRLTIREKDGIKIIDDAYNAAPDSVKSALNTLMSMEGKRKIALLGGMNELGGESARYHREVGAYAAEKEIDLLITVGEKAFDYVAGAREGLGEERILHFAEKEDLYAAAEGLFREGDVVLVKASRGMEFEQIIEKLW
ncbi:MAG: UDP-N-acetylmuramoyl-tripeptide--D-alanyl-D-alanine ligase [Firmicutes bacterium]|nr:UDP-N-acetylmuramoyl-tripeptide--D-alanyl-D-alanine ligase [Bacillota bacterium]